MNEVMKTLYERRAMRKYKSEPIKKALIEEIIAAGRMAPSAMNKQVWKFYVLTNKEEISLFSHELVKAGLTSIKDMSIKDLAKTFIAGITHLAHGIDFSKAKDPVFYNAPAVIFITGPKNYEWAALDIGMCAQNMMIAAKSLGLDSCPLGFGKFVSKTKDYPKLKISDNEEVHLALIFGYGNENPPLHERKTDNVVYL